MKIPRGIFDFIELITVTAALSDKVPLMTAAEELTCGDGNSLNRFRAHVITGRKGVQRL